jgi:hypothetical protein
MTQPLHFRKNELRGERKTLLSHSNYIILDEFMGFFLPLHRAF